jgi:hypothetical protein
MKKTLILIIILLCGCAAKKEKTNTTVRDRLVTKTEYVSLPISTNYEFKLECDSLGNVKPINFLNSSGINQANFNINGNVLDIRLLTGQSVSTNVNDTSTSDVEIVDKELRYRTPFWIYPTFICLILIIVFLAKLASTQLLGIFNKLKFW